MVHPDVETEWRAWASAGALNMAIRHAGESAVRDAVTRVMAVHSRRDRTVRLETTFRDVIGGV